MKKTLQVIIALVLLVLVAGAIWYFNKPKNLPNDNENIASTKNTEVVAGVAASEKVGAATDSVGKTNPFDVNVSPYQGYKNPFQ